MSDTQTNAGTASLVGTYNNIQHTGAVGTGQTNQYGVQNILAGDSTISMGVRNQILTGNNIYGLWNQLKDDSTSYDLYFKSADNTTLDYFSLRTGASGETIIDTVDGGGMAADLKFNVDGDASFNVSGRNFDILWGANNMAGFALSTVKLGHSDSSAYSINRNPTGAGVAGGDFKFLIQDMLLQVVI